jgi:hypoxanthine phosphoribosyltransferase
MKTSISEQQIQKRVKELSINFLKNNKNLEELNLICILEGSLPFFKDLLRNLKQNISDNNLSIKINEYYIQTKSYEGTESTNNLQIKKDLTKQQKQKLKGKEIFIVEDIVDTGNTLAFLINYLNQFEPKSIKIISLLNKPSKRKLQNKSIHPDYCCFEIEDKFVVGYGLDLDGKYRDLRNIIEYESK